MPSPRNSLWLSVTLLFVGVGLGVGGGIWWRSDGVQSKANAESAEVLTGSWWEGERWLSAERIENAVSGMPARELQEFFAGDGKWYRRPNGPGIFRAMMRRLVSLEDPVKVATVVLAWVRREELTVTTRANLLRAVAEILAAKDGFDGAALTPLVGRFSRDDLKAMMEGWLTVRPTESPEAAASYARRWLVAAGLADGKELEVLAQSIALLVWMKRDRELTIRHAAKSDRMAVRAVLTPELRRLLAIDPSAATRLLKTAVEAGVYGETCGESAFKAGFTASQFRAALEGLPAEKIGLYMVYASRMHNVTPDELPELAKAFPAREVFARWDTGDGTLPHGSFAMVSGLAQTDPTAAREWLSTLSPEYRLRVLQEIWTFLDLSNGRIAQLCVEEPKFFEKFNKPTSRVFEALADGDMGNAIRALELIPSAQRDATEANFRMVKIANDHRGDMASALSAADAAPEKLRAEIRDGLIRSFVSDDPQKVYEWIQSHPNDRNEMELHLLDSGSFGKDRREHAELIERRLKKEPSNSKALHWANRVAAGFVYEDPISGLDWLSRLPMRPEINAQVRNMAERSFYESRESAMEWARNLPPGDWRDEASAGIIRAVRFEPEEALRWAESIDNEGKRVEVLRNLVDSWAKAEPTQAMRMVEEATLNEAQREELRLRVQSRSGFGKGAR